MKEEPIDDFSTLRITAEENILYLLEELDHALERAGLAWTPDQAKAAKRLMTSVANKLGRAPPGRTGVHGSSDLCGYTLAARKRLIVAGRE
jgi:hypothetical protein